MKKKTTIKKIIFLIIAGIPAIILSLFLAGFLLFYIMLYISSQYSVNIFEINNDNYNLCYKLFSEETKDEDYFNKEYYLRELSGKETPEEIVTTIRNRKSMEKMEENNNRSGFGVGFLLGRWIK